MIRKQKKTRNERNWEERKRRERLLSKKMFFRSLHSGVLICVRFFFFLFFHLPRHHLSFLSLLLFLPSFLPYDNFVLSIVLGCYFKNSFCFQFFFVTILNSTLSAIVVSENKPSIFFVDNYNIINDNNNFWNLLRIFLFTRRNEVGSATLSFFLPHNP